MEMPHVGKLPGSEEQPGRLFSLTLDSRFKQANQGLRPTGCSDHSQVGPNN